MDSLNCLIDWYKLQCDGVWEKNIRISICTVDNPGWFIKINLIGTNCEYKKFDKVKIRFDEMDWYICYVRDGSFEGAGGPLHLSTILKIFCDWVEK